MFIRTVFLLAATVALASAAHATAIFTKAGASSSSWIVIGSGVGTYENGPDVETTVYSPDQYASVGNFHQGNSFETVDNRGAGAVQFTSEAIVDLFVSAKAVAAAVPGTDRASGYVTGSAFYDFSIDTDSVISLSYIASTPNYTGSDIIARLFSRTDAGFPDDYFLNGQLKGLGQLSYALPAGDYSFQIGASAFPSLLENVPFYQNNTDSQSAEVSLSINSPSLPTPPTPAVPEPATWAMMIMGFAAVGAASRVRRRAVLQIA